MANPQCENGFVRIANEIVDRLCSYRIPGQEMQIIWAVIRQTWGFRKKTAKIPLSKFAKMTGIDRRRCHEILIRLVGKNIIIKSVTQKGDKELIFYGIQKNYDKWKVSPKKVTVTQNGDKVSPKMVTKLSPKKTPLKERKKTLKKYTQLAVEIYDIYPRKADRKNTIKSIERLLHSGISTESLSVAVQNYSAHIQRKGTGRDYIIQSNNFFGRASRWEEWVDGGPPGENPVEKYEPEITDTEALYS